MGNPITWRTVNGPSLGDPSRSMELASRSFNGMFSGLQDELKRSEAIDAANVVANRENQVNAYKAALYQQNSPEALAAAKPALDQMLSGMDSRSKAAVLGADEARTMALRQQMQEAWKYQSAATDQTEAPIRDTISALTAQGKFGEADTLLTQNNLRNEAALYDGLRTGQRRVVTEKQVDDKFGFDKEAAARQQAEEARKVEMFPLEQARIRASINSANASASASNESVLTNRAQREKSEADRLAALNTAKLGVALQDNIYKEGVYTDASAADIMKMMIDNGVGGPKEASDSPAKRQKIIERLSKIREIPITVDGPDGQKIIQKVPLPLGAVKAAILGAGDNVLSWNEGRADNVETALKAQLQAIYQSKDASGKPIVASRAVDDYQNFLAIQSAAAASAAGGTKPKKPKSQ